MTTVVGKRTKLLDTIDLTGDEPVITTEAVSEEVPIVSLDGGEIDPTIVDTKNKKMCEVCVDEESKYTCPACKMRTCCLDCVQEHKLKTGCSGRKDSTRFVARQDMDNFTLLSDYRFIEDVSRVVDIAKRDYRTKPTKPHKRAVVLGHAAKRSGVKLFRMNQGMKRKRDNKTYVKQGCIYWTVKLKFTNCDEEIFKKGVAETTTMEEILAPYTDPEKVEEVNKYKLAAYVYRNKSCDFTVFFRQEYQHGVNNTRYTEVRLTSTLKEALVSKSIIEYPTFCITMDDVTERLRTEKFLPEKSENLLVSPMLPGADPLASEADDSSSDEENEQQETESMSNDSNTNVLNKKKNPLAERTNNANSFGKKNGYHPNNGFANKNQHLNRSKNDRQQNGFNHRPPLNHDGIPDKRPRFDPPYKRNGQFNGSKSSGLDIPFYEELNAANPYKDINHHSNDQNYGLPKQNFGNGGFSYGLAPNTTNNDSYENQAPPELTNFEHGPHVSQEALRSNGNQGPPNGHTGPQEETGHHGPIGYRGAPMHQELPGPRGPLVHQGLPGNQNLTGIEGPRINQASSTYQGPRSPQMTSGQQGPHGIHSQAGNQGPPGPQETYGQQGPYGNRGPIGHQRSTRNQVPLRHQGPPGYRQPLGPQGPSRPQIAPRAPGPPTPHGPQGPQGPPRPQAVNTSSYGLASGHQGSIPPHPIRPVRPSPGQTGHRGPIGSHVGPMEPRGPIRPQQPFGYQGQGGLSGPRPPHEPVRPQEATESVRTNEPHRPHGHMSSQGPFRAQGPMEHHGSINSQESGNPQKLFNHQQGDVNGNLTYQGQFQQNHSFQHGVRNQTNYGIQSQGHFEQNGGPHPQEQNNGVPQRFEPRGASIQNFPARPHYNENNNAFETCRPNTYGYGAPNSQEFQTHM